MFEIFVFQTWFCPWIRSKFKNRATSCTLSVFVACSCKLSRGCVQPIVLDASDKLFPRFANLTLKIKSRSKILFSNGSPGQNIWVHKIFSRYAENSVFEVDPRLEKKKRKIGLSQPMKPTTLASCNYDESARLNITHHSEKLNFLWHFN